MSGREERRKTLERLRRAPIVAGVLAWALLSWLAGGCGAPSAGSAGQRSTPVSSQPQEVRATAARTERPAAEMPYGRIDWERGVMVAVGRGFPPTGTGNASQRKLLARRAAVVDAERNLARLAELARSGEAGEAQGALTPPDGSTEGQVILESVRGARIVSERQGDDGAVEVTMEAPIPGPS